MSTSGSATSSLLGELSNNLASAVETAGQAVVAVFARGRMPSSGVHWSPGIIVTANHTVERDEDISILRDGSGSLAAQLAGRDPSTDIAVLRATNLKSPCAEIADAEQLKVGHFVLALARGAEAGISASLGVLSALGPAWTTWHGGRVDRFIRADLDLYAGFSGGPLVTAQGKTIGINTSGLSRRFDLTVSASTVQRVVDQLLAKGRIARGYLGVGMQPIRLPDALTRELKLDSSGSIIVVSVEPGQAADKAGMMIGDVLLALDGSTISDPEDILVMLGPERVGKPLQARILRAGRVTEVTVTVGERPAETD